MSRVATRLLCLAAALLCGCVAGLLRPEPAYACSCVQMSSSRALRNADAVFRGTVTEQDRVKQKDGARIDFRFQVSDVFKGTVYADQVVATDASPSSCALNLDVGSTWVIFATDGIEGSGDRAVTRLVTSLCSGNLAGGNAPALLGRPHPPMAGASDREERSVDTDRRVTRGVLIAGFGFLGVGALMAVGLALVWRGRRPGSGSAGPKR